MKDPNSVLHISNILALWKTYHELGGKSTEHGVQRIELIRMIRINKYRVLIDKITILNETSGI